MSKKNDKDKTIIEAAEKIFSEYGYVNARMTDIAKTAGISYGSLYHRYKSKDALFDKIVEDWWTKVFTALSATKTRNTDTRGKLEYLVRFLLDAYATNPHQVIIYTTEVSRGIVYRSESHGLKNMLKVFTLCQNILSEGQARGEIRRDISANHLSNVFSRGHKIHFLAGLVYRRIELTPDRRARIIKSTMNAFLLGQWPGIKLISLMKIAERKVTF